MSLQWHYQSRPDVGILALAGKLGVKDAPILHGAIGWTLYHGTGPLILDLSALTAWTSLGQAAVIESALRLAKAQRRLEIAALPTGYPDLVTDTEHAAIPVHTDVLSALTANHATIEPAGELREWRSAGWPDSDPRTRQPGSARRP
ncbi:MAG: anti-sigma factor antagonist [Catenulispora sp.]|nr:anti-sigma factor antagonist [Catenulispora sp.]NUR60025.1 anti-sigma factor antagonist [Catenulispora sp.]